MDITNYEKGNTNMNLIDMHCDTLWQLLDLKGSGNLYKNDCNVSIPGMRKAGTTAQFFACFTDVRSYGNEDGYERCYIHVQEMIHFMEKQFILFPGDIAPAYSYNDVRKNQSEGKISVILAVEEGGILNYKKERLDDLYERGVRLMTLMGNYENCLGYPGSTDRFMMEKGLKPFGIEIVERMGESGMIIDVSHASDGTFWDILHYAEGPVVASHSNCRALCGHPRNLTDEMIRALADAGGIAGLNFYGRFLGQYEESRLEDMTRHILHMIDVGGSGFPAIGTDFDGFGGMKYLDIPDVSHMEKLWDALKSKGVPESQLDKIWNENVLRIIKEIS